jgi:hypothetical protein
MRLYLDTFCEVYDLLKPLATGEFWDFGSVEVEPGAVYLISRKEFNTHVKRLQAIAEAGTCTIIFSNPHEGSWTMIGQCDRLAINTLVQQGRILLVSGGDMDSAYPNLMYDSFLPKPLDYAENLLAQREYSERQRAQRRYKFLFLNGRARPHRKTLLQRLAPLLDQAIWTNLDSAAGTVQTLPAEYEYPSYKNNTTQESGYVKYDLFGNDWGEIYLHAEPYLDTYFSLVTETVFEYPYSFRTEKIAKPLMIGHPFIVAANTGYYRDLRNLGFQTFGTWIDESFDAVEDNDLRLERIAAEVEWLCEQDLVKFSQEVYNVCKYNQQHLAELAPQIRAEFPQRFEQYINERPRV